MLKIDFNLSILIPAWNAEKYIENTIKSLLKNNYENYKIIIIAGGSDETYNLALKLQKENLNKIIVLEQKIPHINKALNIGLKEADGDIIVLTDIDCIFFKEWLSKINEIFQNKKYNVITGTAFPFQDRNNSLAEFCNLTVGYFIASREQAEVIDGGKLCGANSAFRKNIFLKKLGKFNENIKTQDDRYLGLQFNKHGENVFFIKDIYVYTEYYTNNLRKFIRREIRWTRSKLISLNKKTFLQILISLGIGLFKLFYPIVAVLLALLFFNISYILLFLLPWIMIYFYVLIKYYFKLKKSSIKVYEQLHKKFSYKNAFKIVPLMFFISAIPPVIGYLLPKGDKW